MDGGRLSATEGVTVGTSVSVLIVGESVVSHVFPQRRHLALTGEEGDIKSLACMNC